MTAVAEADSLTVQKELVANTKGLYSVLGPYSIASELKDGRLQASRLVKPDLFRHTTLALPKQGKLSPACRVVAEVVQQLTLTWGSQLTEPGSEVPGSASATRPRRSAKQGHRR